MPLTLSPARPSRADVPRPRSALSRYWEDARAPRYSLLFALPLLVLYETLAASLGGGGTMAVRNGADVLLQQVAGAVGGARGPMAIGAAMLILCAVLVIRDGRRNGGVRGRVFLGMFAESAAMASVFGLAVGLVTAQLLSPLGLLAIPADTPMDKLPLGTQVMLSLGAGLYEELVFRVGLVGALGLGARTLLGWTRTTSAIFAVGLGSLVFSAVHYIGPYGDPFTIGSFVFRAIAGVFLSAIFVLRGFGIAAWTHALYDLYLVLLT